MLVVLGGLVVDSGIRCILLHRLDAVDGTGLRLVALTGGDHLAVGGLKPERNSPALFLKISNLPAIVHPFGVVMCWLETIDMSGTLLVFGAGTDHLGARRYRPHMSNSAHWAASAGNKFREVGRTTENPTTKLLAEGLTHLSEAVRELHQELERSTSQVRNHG